MDPITAKLMSAAGAAADKVYVDDVFKISPYIGDGDSSTVVPSIDITGDGGAVIVKKRFSTGGANSGSWHIADTVRGAGKILFLNSTDSEITSSDRIPAITSTGFKPGSNVQTNDSGANSGFVGYTFKKAPGFFDFVTYTGNGTSGRTVSHNLGSIPGCIMVKNLSAGEYWEVYHRGIDSTAPENYRINLNRTAARSDSSTQWNDTAPTSTEFTLGTNDGVNKNNDSYVAYIFAHDDQSFGDAGNESAIKCGSYTGTGAAGNQITLGFEPQWLLVKNTSDNQNWEVFDNMRGVATGGIASELFLNLGSAERSSFNIFNFNPTGFETESTLDETNANGNNYIYIAIRRPHKPPTAATEVFALDTQNSGSYSSPPYFRSGFAVDAAIRYHFPSGYGRFGARKLGDKFNLLHDTSAASPFSGIFRWDYNNGFQVTPSSVDANTGSYMFKRAPKFFDVVAYSGNSTSGRAVSHNLGVVPELMVFKSRDGNRAWRVYDANTGAGGSLRLNADAAKDSNSAYFSTPTADNIILGNDNDTNSSSYDYIAYLFATLPGISKIGTFSGTGSDINVDCGFTAGARFILIKRTDSSGDWYVWDSLRGIVSGNDSYVRFNHYSAQVTNTDYIDPLNAGFTVTSSAPAAINTSGGTYLFLAIA